MYDPVNLAKDLEKVVCKGLERKYYRVARGGRWYGGIATADNHQLVGIVADAA